MQDAVNQYAVHSPFVFGLIKHVIKPGSPQAICGPVEQLREKLRHDRTRILKTDFGSGSGGEYVLRHEVRISSLAKNSSVPTRQAARLFYLIRHLEITDILEFGTSLGISTAYMAKANPSAKIVTMEGCPELAARARANFSSLKLENIEILTGNFGDILDEALRRFEKLGLVFFDGNHRLLPTLDYFQKCLEKVNNDTVFVFDDIHSSEEMQQAWEEIKKYPEVTVTVDLYHAGWVFFRKELSVQHFTLRYP